MISSYVLLWCCGIFSSKPFLLKEAPFGPIWTLLDHFRQGKGRKRKEGKRYKRKTTANKKRAMNGDNPWCLNELQCSTLSVVKCVAVQDKAWFKNGLMLPTGQWYAPSAVNYIAYSAYPALSCTILHYLAISCTFLYYIALYCTILHYLALSCTIFHNLVLSCTILH